VQAFCSAERRRAYRGVGGVCGWTAHRFAACGGGIPGVGAGKSADEKVLNFIQNNAELL
jgi:hypothetical protein